MSRPTRNRLVLACLFVLAAGCASSSSSVTPDDSTEAPAVLAAYDRAWRSRNIEDYQRARDELAAYLADHDQQPGGQLVRLKQGKLLYALGEWRAAAETFASAVDGVRPDPLSQAAARNAVLAWRKALENGDRSPDGFIPLAAATNIDELALPFSSPAMALKALEDGQQYAPEDLGELEHQLASAADTYFKIADRKDPALRSIRFTSVHIYFKRHRFTEAADRCVEVVELWPRSKEASACVVSTIDALGLEKRWDRLATLTRGFKAVWLPNRTTLLDRLNEVLEHSAFNAILQEIEGREDAESAARAAEKFREYQQEFPSSPFSDRALFNAMVYYSKAKQTSDAIATGQLLLTSYPSSALRRETTAALEQLRRAAGR